MKEFQSTITISAEPAAIWAILTDASQWTAWNPTVEKIEGKIAAGETIKVYATISPGRAFPVKVSEFAPPSKMVWTGGMPLGLFKGTRVFTLTQVADGQTEFFMHEKFTGLMAPLITKSIPDLQPTFEEFSAALKARVETPATEPA